MNREKYHKQYYIDNKEVIIKKNKLYHQKNKEKINELKKKYVKEHKHISRAKYWRKQYRKLIGETKRCKYCGETKNIADFRYIDIKKYSNSISFRNFENDINLKYKYYEHLRRRFSNKCKVCEKNNNITIIDRVNYIKDLLKL